MGSFVWWLYPGRNDDWKTIFLDRFQARAKFPFPEAVPQLMCFHTSSTASRLPENLVLLLILLAFI